MFSRLSKTYQKLLKNHFVAVQAVQTGCLMATGDVIAQTVVEKKPLQKVQLDRTARFFTVGLCLVGPTITVWYRFLNTKLGENGLKIALKKMACDQLLFAPAFLVVIVGTLNLIEGKTVEKVKTELYDKYFDILRVNYTIWPAFQIANFAIIPLSYQVLAVQIVALIWNIYLSWKTALDLENN